MSDVESAKYWLSWLEVGSQIAIILVVIGVGYDFIEKRIAGPLHNIIDTARETQFEQLRKETAEAQKELVQAQLALKRANERASQRILNGEFEKELKGEPKGSVRLLYKPKDSEAFLLALQLWRALNDFGWPTSGPEEIPSNVRNPELAKDAPLDLQYGIASGLGVRANPTDMQPKESASLQALMRALGFGVSGTSGFTLISGDPAINPQHFIVVIGQKM